MANKTGANKGIKLIKKSNELIEARYKFDIWETRIFSTVLAQIGRNDEDFQVYRIYLRDIIKEFGINNGNAYDLLREAADNLMNKKFFLDYEGDGAERKKVYHIIRSVDYMTKLKEESKRGLNEYVDVSIDPDMKPLLLQLKAQFTTYDIRNIIKFKSGYTVRIYELLKQYEGIGHRKIAVENLKEAFEITEEYPLFANFYQKVIEPAHRDINEHTDLEITDIEKIKEGKKVVALRFVFHRKVAHDFNKKKTAKPLQLPFVAEPIVLLNSTTTNDVDAIFVKFQSRVVGDFGVTPTIFLVALQGKNEEQVTQAINVTEDARKRGDLNNIAGFFIEALRQGFTNVATEKKAKAKKTASSVAKREAAIFAAEQTYHQAVNDKIRELTATDPTITEKAIEKVEKSIAGKFRLKTVGVKNPTLDNFRQDDVLREFVKMAIIEDYKAVFEQLTQTFEMEKNAIG